MEQEEFVGPACRVALVQEPHAIERGQDVAIVLGSIFFLGVGEVGQEGEAKMRIGIGEIGDLEPFQQDRRAIGRTSMLGTTTNVVQSAGIPALKSSLASFLGGIRIVTRWLTIPTAISLAGRINTRIRSARRPIPAVNPPLKTTSGPIKASINSVIDPKYVSNG